MRPTLPAECDIEIVPLPSQTPLGALIVFVIDDTLIAHRLVRRSGGRWIAQGDGRLGPDRPLESSQVLGLVSAAYQNGRRCWPTGASRCSRDSGWLGIGRCGRRGPCGGPCGEADRPFHAITRDWLMRDPIFPGSGLFFPAPDCGTEAQAGTSQIRRNLV